jgi:hypothetical protein
MVMLRTFRFVVVAVAACALLPTLPVEAQVADAVLEVVVTDPNAQALPGVTVAIARPDTGYTQTVVTDAAGLARVPALSPGTYDVVLTLSGFAPQTRQGLTLRVGQTVRVSVSLTVAAVTAEITVIGQSPLVDVHKTDSSSNIVPEQIEALPVQDRDFQRLAFLAPGVQRERGGFRFIGGGPVIGAGGNASQSTILVDGVDSTDAVLGLARVRFSQDAISEFRVITNRFDTEIGGSAGGALSIVTKSGTNTTRGSVFGFLRNDGLRALREFETAKSAYSRQQFGVALGGPIAKNRTHFFLSAEQIGEDNTTLFRPGGAYASTASDPTVPFDQTLLFGGVDHRVTDSQTLRLKVVYERFRQENFRVGSVVSETAGMQLNRDNLNVTGIHTWASGASVNQLSTQLGRRKFDEPNNSTDLSEFFSSGNTLQTGANIVGDQVDTGTVFEVRDTFYSRVGSGRWAADVKFGGAWQRVTDEWDFPVYPRNLMIYITDTRALPLVFVNATGSGRSKITTNLIAGFAQADFRPSTRVTLSAGVRYDLDTAGNNPGYTSPLQTTARGKDANNIQPRAGFTWDIAGTGAHVLRGGAGIFTGRFLLVPAHSELQQNSFTGRIIQQRLNGALIGIPALALNPASPTTTGIALAKDATRLDTTFVSPHAMQATAGYTVRLGRTGLYADIEGVYVKGDDEIAVRDTNWKGNATGGRISSTLNQINTYTNGGRSRYAAMVFSLNGTIRGGHLVTTSMTVADKKNIADDFSPALTDYPNDPADLEAEYGRARADERVRVVASGVFKLPYRFMLAPTVEYGSGQPWNRRRGYDYNGDGKNSDRLPGITKFSEDGPSFTQVNLRLQHKLTLGSRASLDLIADAFNIFNRVNHDVNSLINSEFLSGPTLANAALVAVPNPRYRQYTAALPSRELQLGVRITF